MFLVIYQWPSLGGASVAMREILQQEKVKCLIICHCENSEARGKFEVKWSKLQINCRLVSIPWPSNPYPTECFKNLMNSIAMKKEEERKKEEEINVKSYEIMLDAQEN